MARSAISRNGISNVSNGQIKNAWTMFKVGSPALFATVLMVLCLSKGAAGLTQVSLSTTSISFGSVTTGSSATQDVTITNSGTWSARLLQAVVKGTGFSISGLVLPLTLDARQSTSFEVTFAPTTGGSVTGSITIECTSRFVPLSISLSGTGVAPSPSAVLSVASLAFGNQSLGTSSTAQTVTLSDAGNAALSITSIGLTGANPSDFAQSNSCGSSLAAGASCTISVTFTPAASGSLSAAVSVSDNATGSPQTVTLSGTGTNPGVSLAPSSLSFGSEPIDVTSSAQIITLSNTGSAALSITSLGITGANAGDFAETADTCGNSVAAGANCTIGITFTPSLAAAESASLSITDNTSGSPQTAALSGTGEHDVILTWTPSTTSGVAGYNVYRGTTSGGESSTPINSSLVTGTTYIDSNVQAGQTYFYLVTSVGSDETTQSADSNEASASVPTP